MKIGQFFGKLFGFLIDVFGNVLKTIFDQVLREFLSDIWDIVVSEVSNLDSIPDLLDGEKRQRAFENIRDRIKAEGMNVKDSVVNLAIELAVQYLKKLKRND